MHDACRFGGPSQPSSGTWHGTAWLGILTDPGSAPPVVTAINNLRAKAGVDLVAWDTNTAFDALAATSKCEVPQTEGVVAQFFPDSDGEEVSSNRFLLAVERW